MHIEFKENFNVKNLTSFKIGGNIKKVYFPKSVNEFAEVLECEKNCLIYGNLSNTLVSSDGYDGVVIITSKMENYSRKSDTIFYAECGIKGPKLSQIAQQSGRHLSHQEA